MKYLAHLCALLLILSVVVAPAAATDGRYSYITVTSVDVALENENATVTLTYTIDEGIQILVHFLGMSDLRTKVIDIANFKNAEILEIDMEHAVLLVPGAGLDYGEGAYWFPKHEFGVAVPVLTVTSPQDSRTFTNTTDFPRGMGYFRV
ncbi:hypothetical protein [Methanofollis fontis]|uniref:Uncharacterized protein n=1 Tax=Methanofollis fontis TaxID=2052832 RepID=A0A483CUP5_9EURY|nr:hypothetical protein [Methanofollis fontis]TAJ44657.1 hypothetical protein CUJ86_04950 [Methanofollis fontis]